MVKNKNTSTKIFLQIMHVWAERLQHDRLVAPYFFWGAMDFLWGYLRPCYYPQVARVGLDQIPKQLRSDLFDPQTFPFHQKEENFFCEGAQQVRPLFLHQKGWGCTITVWEDGQENEYLLEDEEG